MTFYLSLQSAMKTGNALCLGFFGKASSEMQGLKLACIINISKALEPYKCRANY